ncbi:hypothetical protein PoB_003560500 [Plakobranchus ocellatus]|uniref:Uncharacterized protein n=1 Tax=Plakobranchus ocellatus TaxID=259542 RepID=A0AAV4ALN4_9GAST|nr:hypothetical protein PoB_003560500 [Plakobranchus ocellatus]
MGVTALVSSQPSHTITCSMFPWDNRGDGRPTDTTLLNTLAPVRVAHGLLTHGTTKLPLPPTKRTKNSYKCVSRYYNGKKLIHMGIPEEEKEEEEKEKEKEEEWEEEEGEEEKGEEEEQQQPSRYIHRSVGGVGA